jgi:hypothetical protein
MIPHAPYLTPSRQSQWIELDNNNKNNMSNRNPGKVYSNGMQVYAEI